MCLVADHLRRREMRERVVIEPEARDRVGQAPGSGDDPVPPALGQLAPKTSNTERWEATPDWRAASSIVSSYWSVRSAVALHAVPSTRTEDKALNTGDDSAGWSVTEPQ